MTTPRWGEGAQTTNKTAGEGVFVEEQTVSLHPTVGPH